MYESSINLANQHATKIVVCWLNTNLYYVTNPFPATTRKREKAAWQYETITDIVYYKLQAFVLHTYKILGHKFVLTIHIPLNQYESICEIPKCCSKMAVHYLNINSD